MGRVVAPWLLLLAVTACSTTRYREPTPEELASADYGPSPVSYAERVKALVLVRYRDRAVSSVEVGQPRRMWYGELGRLTKRRDVRYGWGVPFRGFRLGFTSLDTFVVQGMVFFRDDTIEAIQDDQGFRFLEQKN